MNKSFDRLKPRVSIPKFQPSKLRIWQRAVVSAAQILEVVHTLQNQTITPHKLEVGTPSSSGLEEERDDAPGKAPVDKEGSDTVLTTSASTSTSSMSTPTVISELDPYTPEIAEMIVELEAGG